jgi:mono/diheme cytochrome c family protein
MARMRVEQGFSVQLVAAEPLINTPIAMTFDDSLRIWAVEMTDYRPLNKGDHAEAPLGKVVILTDSNRDGQMDERKVFLDSLVMPRAICLVGGGVLVAAPPNLWYYPVDHDRPGKKVLVDSAYTVSGNPEGQTNGLLRSLDNWIYDAGFGSSKRYRLVHGKWQTEKTLLRGQWGIAQDDYGHLFYNNNSQNLLGDYFLPGLIPSSNRLANIAGYDEKIVSDNRVFPLRPNQGVNRGYRKGVLDEQSRLVELTAACGPVLYRGDLFSPDYRGNAFLCEPAANLVKRDVLFHRGNAISGRLAYEGREFLSSTDERFRPVNLYNGPGGALYVMDMYRGVIQDNLSLTDYLRNYSIAHKLTLPFDCGRIYKLTPTGRSEDRTILPADAGNLVALLGSPNGWLRDRAQQRLVDENRRDAIPALRRLLADSLHPLALIHALWTLEGLQALRPADVVHLLKSTDGHIAEQALGVMAVTADKASVSVYLKALADRINPCDSLFSPDIAYVLQSLYPYAPAAAAKRMEKLIRLRPEDPYVADAVISGLGGGKEGEAFLARFSDTNGWFPQHMHSLLLKEKTMESNAGWAGLQKLFPEGSAIFSTVCQTCHGADGEGIKFLAPPLNGSEWVRGDKDKLIPIVLYGLSGPITVGGKTYRTPEVIGDMPGFGNGGKFSDKALAQLLSLLRGAWQNRSGRVEETDIVRTKNKFSSRDKAFTMEELRHLSGGKGEKP